MRGFIKGMAVGLVSFGLGFAVFSVAYEPETAPSLPAVESEALPAPAFGEEPEAEVIAAAPDDAGAGVAEEGDGGPGAPEPPMPEAVAPAGAQADPEPAPGSGPAELSDGEMDDVGPEPRVEADAEAGAVEAEPSGDASERLAAAPESGAGEAGQSTAEAGGADDPGEAPVLENTAEPAAAPDAETAEAPVSDPESGAASPFEREEGTRTETADDAMPQQTPERAAITEPEHDADTTAEPEPERLVAPEARGEPEAASVPEAQDAPAAPETPEPEREAERMPDADGLSEPEAQADPAPETAPRTDAEPDAPPAVPPVLRAVPTSPGLDRAVEGVTVGRLPAINRSPGADDPAEEAVAATTPETAAGEQALPARERYAASFDPAPGPLFAVILLDAPADPAAEAAIVGLPMPVAVALDPHDPDAPRRARAYRAAGHEVLVLVTGLPAGATPSDLEVTFDAWFRALPEAVALMESPQDGFQGNRGLAQAIMPFLTADGHGLITFERGLNPVQQSAASAGVATTSVFRMIDGDDENQFVIRRYLDRATFRAQQEGRVVVLGRAANAETIDGLIGWRMEGRAGQVAIVPVSATLRLP